MGFCFVGNKHIKGEVQSFRMVVSLNSLTSHINIIRLNCDTGKIWNINHLTNPYNDFVDINEFAGKSLTLD